MWGGGSPPARPSAADGRSVVDEEAAAGHAARPGAEECAEVGRPPSHSCDANGSAEANSFRAEELVEGGRPPSCSQAPQPPDSVAKQPQLDRKASNPSVTSAPDPTTPTPQLTPSSFPALTPATPEPAGAEAAAGAPHFSASSTEALRGVPVDLQSPATHPQTRGGRVRRRRPHARSPEGSPQQNQTPATPPGSHDRPFNIRGALLDGLVITLVAVTSILRYSEFF